MNTKTEAKINFILTALLHIAIGFLLAAFLACPFLLDEAELLWTR